MNKNNTGLGIQEIVGDKREAVIQLAAKHGAHNLRVFGSVARGDALDDSDIDLLVDFDAHTSIYDMAELQFQLQTLLRRRVDIVDSQTPKTRFLERISKDAVPL